MILVATPHHDCGLFYREGVHGSFKPGLRSFGVPPVNTQRMSESSAKDEHVGNHLHPSPSHPFPITNFHRMLTSICLSSFALVTIATGRGMDLTLTIGSLWETNHEPSKLPEVLPLWSHRWPVSSRVQVRLSHIYTHSQLSGLHLLEGFVERCGTQGKQRSKSKYANWSLCIYKDILHSQKLWHYKAVLNDPCLL